MTFFKSTWMIVIYCLLGLSIILYFTGRKEVHTEVYIKASPEEVWSVITSTNLYADWNTVFEVRDGELIEGNKVSYRFMSSPSKTEDITAKVKTLQAKKLLNQSGGMPFIITFNHKYILEKTDNGCKLTIHEDYRGLMVNFWSPNEVKLAYERLAIDIKNRAESLNSNN